MNSTSFPLGQVRRHISWTFRDSSHSFTYTNQTFQSIHPFTNHLYYGDTGVDGMMILKWILYKYFVNV